MVIPFCGWANANKCPRCHHELDADDESLFCPECGWRPIDPADEQGEP